MLFISCLFLALVASVSHGSRAQVRHARTLHSACDEHASLQGLAASSPPCYSLADLRQLLLDGRCVPLRVLAHLLLAFNSSPGWQVGGQGFSHFMRNPSVGDGRLNPAVLMRQQDDIQKIELDSQGSSRRSLLAKVFSTASLLIAPRALAVDKGDKKSVPTAPVAMAESNELWPKDGLFPDCPSTDTCVSSQDDRPKNWDNPWVAEGETLKEFKRLRKLIESKNFGGRIVSTDGERYIKAEFQESGVLGTSIDDAEFFFGPNDVLWQFRAVRRGDALTDFGANRKRLEEMRIALGYEKVPVLRNRRRALVIVESPFDTFGPATYDKDDMGFNYRDQEYGGKSLEPAGKYNDKNAPNGLLKWFWQEGDDRVDPSTNIR